MSKNALNFLDAPASSGKRFAMELWQPDLLRGIAFDAVCEEVRLAHGLSSKEAAFVFQYPIDKNGTKAAERAGYSKHTAPQQASRLLRKVKVQKALQALFDRLHAKAEITAQKIREELACSAFFDPSWIKNEDGTVKPWKDWPEVARRAMPTVTGREILTLEKDKDGKEVLVRSVDHEIRAPGKGEALKLLGQEKKMWAGEDGGGLVGRFIMVTG